MKIATALFFTAFALVALYGCFILGWGALFAVFGGGFSGVAAGHWRDIWEQERWRWN